jgi:16S rRNA (uracil1498-N3)-methyltransferase
VRQIVLPREWDGGPECRLAPREAQHLLRVLRLGPGDRVPGVDARGRRHSCEILAIEGGALRLAVFPADEGVIPEPLPDLRGSATANSIRQSEPVSTTRDAPDSRPLPRIVLAAALLKGDRFDLVVRQATEAGVALVLPLLTERSLGSPAGPVRRERLERIVREALQQSGSSVPTSVGDATPLRGLQARLGPPVGKRLSLVLHELPLAAESLHSYLGHHADEIVICVGPEGGFSPEEISFLREAGFLPLRLPGAVLRAETAALFAVAAVEAIHSERDSWIPAQA